MDYKHLSSRCKVRLSTEGLRPSHIKWDRTTGRQHCCAHTTTSQNIRTKHDHQRRQTALVLVITRVAVQTLTSFVTGVTGRYPEHRVITPQIRIREVVGSNTVHGDAGIVLIFGSVTTIRLKISYINYNVFWVIVAFIG